MKLQVEEIISKMSVENKLSFISGEDDWHTKRMEQFGIEAVTMIDGPNGLRKEIPGKTQESYPATCFPSLAGMAATWNPESMAKMAGLLAKECQAENIDILLGPGINIKRSPLCGRNFEYLSEDPYLTGRLASSYIEALQNGGVGAAVKHFTANNQEYQRMVADAVIDDRTLREIYMAGFEEVIRKVKPWLVMCSYNKVNGTYMSENKEILTDVLRKDWRFDGVVVSDWGAVNDREKGIAAGMDLEMPGDKKKADESLRKKIEENSELSEALEVSVRRLLNLVQRCIENRRPVKVDYKEHHEVAVELAAESIVLLKNENHILPFNRNEKIAIIGEFAEFPRFQGGGSAHVNPTRLSSLYDVMKVNSNVKYTPGYRINKKDTERTLCAQAEELAAWADKIVVCLGLPDSFESEYFDRVSLDLPDCQLEMLDRVHKINERLVVILFNGAPVTMPWKDDVAGILEAYLPGQGGSEAISLILYGDRNPSGRLAETFPVRLEDTPAFLDYPGADRRIVYREGIFVGYRYYDKRRIEPLFEFGYGLSYTEFRYDHFYTDRKEIKEGECCHISVNLTNTGTSAGSEVVQLYIGFDGRSRISRAERELRGFQKIFLRPGETKKVSFTLEARSFQYYEPDAASWVTESGCYRVGVGRSSKRIEYSAVLKVEGIYKPALIINRTTTIGDMLLHDNTKALGQALLSELYREKAAGQTYERMGQSRFLTYPLKNLQDLAGKKTAEKLLTEIFGRDENEEGDGILEKK